MRMIYTSKRVCHSTVRIKMSHWIMNFILQNLGKFKSKFYYVIFSKKNAYFGKTALKYLPR